MKNILTIISAFYFLQSTTAQKILKVGDKAPNINITNYILNPPTEKSLTGKFIILEFWATWCAPCIEAVPHLNFLQKKFSKKNDIIFLSLTYESPKQAKRILDRVKFTTTVVSDETKETELNFNVRSIPHTVLIDNKGFIKWIGQPNELNDSLVESFIQGKDIPKGNIEQASTIKVSIETQLSNKSIDNALTLFKDKNTQYLFYILQETRTDNRNPTIANLGSGEYIDMNKSVVNIISKIINKPEPFVIIPDSFHNKKFTIVYKNSNKIGYKNQLLVFKQNILSALNLTENTEIRNSEIYSLEVIDSSLLPISENQFEGQKGNFSDTYFGVKNSKIEELIKQISNHYKIIIVDSTSIKSKFDFLIKATILTETIEDLKKYGLQLRKTTKDIEFNIYK